MRFADGLKDSDLYGLLSSNELATAAELRRAWRQQAKRWHPDKNGPVDTAARMAAINRAFELLNDPDFRREYDASLKAERERGGKDGWVGAGKAGVAASASYLSERGFTVIDGRLRAGVMWVVSAPGLSAELKRLRELGMQFHFEPSGAVATSFKPAWWTRSWG